MTDKWSKDDLPSAAEADRDRWRRAHSIVEQERNQAREQWKKWEHKANEWRARAEAAENRHTWPKMTPTGHTYIAPDTYAALCYQHGNAAQAAIESWDADECPPEPTWEMVGIAHREVERLQRERDEWKARAEANNRYSGTLNHAFVEGAMWATRHVEPKDRHVDQ